MASKVIIVESPTKQKTISKFLDKSFIVKSSYGHIRDLPINELGVDINNGFSPKYIVIEKSKKHIAEIARAVQQSQDVYLATDPDREGEAISWHILEVLGERERKKAKRITFHEITKNAILEAIKNPRDIDLNLVHAQQARRILDRLVGYKLSPLLWEKIRKGLSAGRVQSVAVRLIAERAKEIENFKEEEYYTISGVFEKEGEGRFEARLVKWEDKNVEQTITLHLFAEDYKYKTSIFKTLEDTTKLFSFLKNSEFFIADIEKKTISQKPKPPFITSSLQQDAYNKLGFSSQRTMRTAQSLYEGVNIAGEMSGLITYMRTDSFNVSKEMQKQTAQFIRKNFGAAYAPDIPPEYLKKVKGAQEAHEAIHPTDIEKIPEKIKDFLTQDQFKLYDLIWKRFVASQMSDAVYDLVSVEINDKEKKSLFKVSGRTLKFDGYLKVYMEEKEESDEERDEKLPSLKKGEKISLIDMLPKAHKTSPPPHYNEASLIKILEKHGIGRPSTYAMIISTIIERGYVKREKDKRLTITELGQLVTEKLKEFFPEIMNLSYTANIEDKLDDIADGVTNWEKTVRQFYESFSKEMEKAKLEMKSQKLAQETNEKCPICSSPMILRESKYGKYLSCSKFPKCLGKIVLDKNGNKIEKFQALKTGKKCSKCQKGEMLLRKGPKGFFLGCSRFPKCRNIEKIKDEEVKRIIEENRK